MLCKIKIFDLARKKWFFYMHGTVYGCPARADYEINIIEAEQLHRIKRGKPRLFGKFRVTNTAGHTLHRKKKS